MNNTQKMLYLLDVMRQNTTGRSGVINALYSETIRSNRAVRELQDNLNVNYQYFDAAGEHLQHRAEELLTALERDPDEVLQTLRDIEMHNKSIRQYARAGEQLLRSPSPVKDVISVMDKRNLSSCRKAIKSIASVCVYLLLQHGGAKQTEGLFWLDADGIQEQFRLLNFTFLPALLKIPVQNRMWVITRRHTGGRLMLGESVYDLQYLPAEEAESMFRALRAEPVGTHAFLNADAYEHDEYNVPYCWGTGNIVSAPPSGALRLLTTGVIEQPRSPLEDEYRKKPPVPRRILQLLCGGKPYCVSPETLVSALNRWQAGYDTVRRREAHRCLLCGQHVSAGRMVCPHHFSARA